MKHEFKSTTTTKPVMIEDPNVKLMLEIIRAQLEVMKVLSSPIIFIGDETKES